MESETDESTSDEEDEALDRVPPAITTPHAASALNRPQSSLSSRPYRTPMASMLLVGSPPPHVPTSQPHPGFQTQSAFAESSTSIPSSVYPPTTAVSYPNQLERSPDPTSIHGYPARPSLPPSQTPHRQYSLQSGPPRPVSASASIPMLERAVESTQAHLAAITERLETLELTMHHSSTSLSASGVPRSPVGGPPGDGYGYGYGHGYGAPLRWDLDEMGMWALVLRPLARALALFRRLAAFLAAPGPGPRTRSPTLVVIRRLFLDISFVLCALAVAKAGWRRSGVRRKEVSVALRVLWRAIVGQQAPRRMVERGV